MERERETDEYLEASAAVCPRLDGLSPDLVRALRRRIAYDGARAELERLRAEKWALFLGRPLTPQEEHLALKQARWIGNLD